MDLPLNERQTYLRFLRRRGSIARRPPRNDIGDVDILPIESDRVQHPIQQLPRSSDERAPNSIFIPSRSLADKHDPRTRDAIREHQLRGGPLQRATLEIRHCGAQRFQIGAPPPRARELNFPPHRETESPGRAEAARPRVPLAGGDWRIDTDAFGGSLRSCTEAKPSAKRSRGASSSASVTPTRVHQRSASTAWGALNG